MNPTRGRASILAVLMSGVLLLLASGDALGQSTIGFFATGTLTEIGPVDPRQAGRSHRFLVTGREVSGLLQGAIAGEEPTPFTIPCDGNLPVVTQEGLLRGTLVVPGVTGAKLQAVLRLGLTPVPCNPAEVPVGCVPAPGGHFFVGLLFSGPVIFTSGAEGHGTMNGWILAAPDATGHVPDGPVAGQIDISGQLKLR